MKPLALLLFASLAANAAFIITGVIRTRSDVAIANPSSTVPGSTPTVIASAAPESLSRSDLISALKSENAEAIRDLLREAGLPDETVRMLVGAAVWQRFGERMKALQPTADPTAPWWKNEPNSWYGNLTREQRAEQRRLQREANDEVLRLLGPAKNTGTFNYHDQRLSFLPDAKRQDFQKIEQDYQDLIQEVQQDMQGFSLPSDVEKIRFLQEEKKRDLAAVLTPAELADYELRMSPTAQQLRWKMSRFDGTEEEYRKIFTLQKAFDSTQQLDAWGNVISQGQDDWKKRREAEKQLSAQIKESLGAERYADYVRAQNHEYRQLEVATKRLSLPPDTPANVYALRGDVAAASKLISENTSLAAEQKKQAFTELANRTREQVRTALGPEAADVFLKNGMQWLTTVEQGNVVSFAEDGTQSSRPGIPREPKKPAAPKP